jgi:TrwC relaxase
VAHHTSRAGDPHRHLHLQVNARVFAAGGWRGLHTVGVCDFLGAINGIGHAAVACDPRSRAALAAHGYALNPAGEIRQLADFVGAFSARAARRSPATSRSTNWSGLGRIRANMRGRRCVGRGTPGPGPKAAPDKVTPTSGADLTTRWQAELAALGYRDPSRPAELTPTAIGALDRDEAAGRVLARLAAGRSAWNAADVRGEAEQLIAADGIVADPAVRAELDETSPPAPCPDAFHWSTAMACPSTSARRPRSRRSTWRPTSPPGWPPATSTHTRLRAHRGRCPPDDPRQCVAWTSGRRRRSPPWPATGRWWLWRAQPARARPPPSPPPATCSSSRGAG